MWYNAIICGSLGKNLPNQQTVTYLAIHIRIRIRIQFHQSNLIENQTKANNFKINAKFTRQIEPKLWAVSASKKIGVSWFDTPKSMAHENLHQSQTRLPWNLQVGHKYFRWTNSKFILIVCRIWRLISFLSRYLPSTIKSEKSVFIPSSKNYVILCFLARVKIEKIIFVFNFIGKESSKKEDIDKNGWNYCRIPKSES